VKPANPRKQVDESEVVNIHHDQYTTGYKPQTVGRMRLYFCQYLIIILLTYDVLGGGDDAGDVHTVVGEEFLRFAGLTELVAYADPRDFGG
jgi:hypothetical protein